MVALDVKELSELPDPSPYDENPASFADWVLTACIRCAPAFVVAEYEPSVPSVTWRITSRLPNAQPKTKDFAVSPSLGSFRSVLARFGHHFMGDQLYGGFSRVLLSQNGATFGCSIFMSNEGRSDFWIRAYVYPSC